MSFNEMSLPLAARENSYFGNRLLGILAMIGAPMLLIFILFGNPDGAQKGFNERLMCLTGVLYMGGWLCGAIAMRRLRVTGNGLVGKIVFIIQITLLSFALLFSVMEVGGYNYQNGGVIFALADAGYPLSHLFMNVVGIFVVRAKVWHGLPKFAPFLVGIALPVTMSLLWLGFPNFAGYFFGSMTTLGLGTIACKVYSSRVESEYFCN